MTALFEILKLVRKYHWTLPFLVLLGLLASLAESFSVGLLIPFAQETLGHTASGSSQGLFMDTLYRLTGLLGSDNRTAILGLAIVGLVLTKSALMLGYGALSEWVKERTLHGMRQRMLDNLLSLDYARFSARGPGEYYNVFASETWRASDGIKAFFALLSQLATAAVFTVLLLILSWELVVISALVFGAASLVVRAIAMRAEAHGVAGGEAHGRLADRMFSVLTGMRTVRAFAQEEREREALLKEAGMLRGAFVRLSVLSATIYPTLEAIYLPFLVALVYFSGVLGLQTPALMAFVLLMYRLMPHIKGVEQERVTLAGASGAIHSVVQLLRDTAAPAPPLKPALAPLARSIRFENVGFGYGNAAREAFAVREIDLTIARGSTVALVGASGSGKSTLVNLLLGFYPPTEGRILIDGTPLDDVDMASWRRQVGFAGQDSQLFPGTVAQNIAYGKPDAARAEIEDMARRCDVTEFLSRLPYGLDTWISREGLDLSGGQRQRIALARALLIDPQLLILDEATNAVDNITEATLQRMLREVARTKTILIVAHRMSTIRHADWIVALDKGRIAEQGTPAELLKNNAAFARLYKVEAETGAQELAARA